MKTKRDFWAGRRVLVTGHTGFKGAWLSLWLQELGAHVSGLALAPQPGSLYLSAGIDSGMKTSSIVDIRDADAVHRAMQRIQPEVVFHLAARALVRESYVDPSGTFAVNTQGTVHVLHALQHVESAKAIVAVTTDKVYRNLEQQRAFHEDDPLGGHDPYSASKAAAELAIASYSEAYFRPRGVGLASARAGNVVGGGDWAVDRLLPDAARAWRANACLTIRRPAAVRPWQHVLEPLHGYLALSEHLWRTPEDAQAVNFGPKIDDAQPVSTVVELACAAYGSGQWRADSEISGPHEAGHLALDTTRAHALLGLRPRWGLADAVHRTMTWYRRQADGQDARVLCLADIAAYEAAG